MKIFRLWGIILLLTGGVLALSFTLGWAPPQGNSSEGSAEGLGAIVPEAQVVIPEAPQPLPPSAQDRTGYDTSRNMVVLEPLTVSRGAPDEAGIVRAVSFDGQRHGAWAKRSDGSYLYLVSIRSPGAAGVRLHFESVSMPEGAVLFVYGSRGENMSGSRALLPGVAYGGLVTFGVS